MKTITKSIYQMKNCIEPGLERAAFGNQWPCYTNVSLTANNHVNKRVQGLAQWRLSFLLLAGFLFGPLQLSASDCVAFFKVGPFEVGGQPLHMVTADVNGDGQLDLVIPNAVTGVVVLAGDGTGQFSGPTYPAGVYPHDVAVGDFNGDGKPDLAVAAGIGGNGAGVEVLLNNGDGTFSAPTLYPAENDPSQIVAADFNGDGKLDLAVTDNISGNVDILLGTGTGAFGLPAQFPGTATPTGIAVGDFNGDGKLDLVIANYATQDLRILQGDGNGNFTTIHTYPVGSGNSGNPSEIAIGDFNRDGREDLAVGVHNVLPPGNDHIAIYQGNGDGSFTAGQRIRVGDPAGLVVADLNRDGNLDIAVATYLDNNVTVMLGSGNGKFGVPSVFPLGNFAGLPFDVVTGDFNDDGKPDLALVDYANGTVVVGIGRSCSH